MYLLNIGLANFPAEAGVSIGRRALFAARAMRAVGLLNLGAQIVISDTEPTLVVKMQASVDLPSNRSGNAVRNAVFKLAEALNQDCIAVYPPIADKGELVGPRAAQWGEFNPELFFKLDGSRLGVAA
jgi:hypothetical protein